MGVYTIRLPDIGEGIAEAELVEWHVKLGDKVREDTTVAVVMTDKAAVEVPSSVSGIVSWLGGEVGDLISVGGKLIQLDVEGQGNSFDGEQELNAQVNYSEKLDSEQSELASRESTLGSSHGEGRKPIVDTSFDHSSNESHLPKQVPSIVNGAKPLAAPSVRARAKEEGIDLRHVSGSGPSGRINHQDLTDFIAGGKAYQNNSVRPKNTNIKEIKVVGMRRKIAEKMAMSKARIPHITIVEEVDMTELEGLRTALNKKYVGERPKLTLIPFMMRAIVEAVQEQPEFNARYVVGEC